MDENSESNINSAKEESACEDRYENSQMEASNALAKGTLRFMVENVESPEHTGQKGSKDSAEFSFPDHSETIGFATHEAVPMTLFYRNTSSVGENAVQRPTLKKLHEGFDVLDEEIVSIIIAMDENCLAIVCIA